MSITRIAIYHNTNPGHSKQYTIVVEEDDAQRGIYSVMGRWGKIGYSDQGTKEYKTAVSRIVAMSQFAAMERERFDKGYHKISDSSEVIATSPQRNPIRAMITAVTKPLEKPATSKPKKKPVDLRPNAGRKVESEED